MLLYEHVTDICGHNVSQYLLTAAYLGASVQMYYSETGTEPSTHQSVTLNVRALHHNVA